MKIYNPIVTGKPITFDDNRKFNQDSMMVFEDAEGIEIIKKYPFLVNMDDPSKGPDACEDTRQIDMKEWYSGRATARLADELRSITVGVSSSIKELGVTVETLHDNNADQLSKITAVMHETNALLRGVSINLSRSNELNHKILEELTLQRTSKFSFKKLFKRNVLE